ncbi:hypothetical protein [Streptomyces bohaiensis]|uniref:Uncharacterized protein n=1 Tax=Streptomyces bohaiensis TaxID=1431344 RepID=A0ABX1C5G6_9ACTN|nr:hypothetical protein [Streptomyces bohaiensis]NJQ14153.1 hypothetical protein [Streptomyces bohaiensis]
MKGDPYYGPQKDPARSTEFERRVLALLDEYGYWIGGAPSIEVGVWEAGSGTWVGILEGTGRAAVAKRTGLPPRRPIRP